MESSPLVSLVPVLNASQALRAILQGEPNPLLLLITNGANILYAALCFAIAVRQFNNEKVLFRT
jgi:ABC-type Na+ efflux pump permease subunit